MAKGNQDRSELTNLISSEGFSNLSVEDKHIVIDKVSNSSSALENILGNNKEIIGMIMAFFLALGLIIAGIIVWINSSDTQIWSVFVPAITSAIGFICGKSSK